MTRFNISLSEGVNYVLWTLNNAYGGEIIVPKLKSFYIKDLVEAISGKKNNFKIVGIRPGEKIHEELINPAESRYTVEFKDFYMILADIKDEDLINYCKINKCKKVKKGFSYNSGDNKTFLDIKGLKKVVAKS